MNYFAEFPSFLIINDIQAIPAATYTHEYLLNISVYLIITFLINFWPPWNLLQSSSEKKKL